MPDPGPFDVSGIKFPTNRVLRGHQNMFSWQQTLHEELVALHPAFESYLQEGAVPSGFENPHQVAFYMDQALNTVIRNNVTAAPRAMIRHIYGIAALQKLRNAYGTDAARFCIDMIRQGVAAPQNPDIGIRERVQLMAKTWQQVQGAGLTLSQLFAIFSVISFRNDHLVDLVRSGRNHAPLEAYNLEAMVEELARIEPEAFVDTESEHVPDTREARLREMKRRTKSGRLRPRDASHRCTRCGFLGHRSAACRLDINEVERYHRIRSGHLSMWETNE